jgi:hypothetical protein
MPFDFSDECKKNQVNESFSRKIDERLFPILEKAVTLNPVFNMFLTQKMEEAQRTIFTNFSVFETLVHLKIKKQLELTPREFATLFLIDYLVLVESVFTYIVDIVAYALVSVGKTLTDPRTKREAVLPDEIKMVSLGTKLDFLRSNGFSMIADRCSVRLRNSSAHLSFALDKIGNVTLPEGDFVAVFDGMNELHDRLRDAAIGGHIATRHYYYEKYGKYMP